MDLLIVEAIEEDVVRWLDARHSVRYEPALAQDPRAFRQALYNVRALVLPPSIAIDAQALHYAPVLRAVGRVSAGAENIDLDACARAGVEVVRSATATAQAEAEFVIGAMLSLLRRVPVVGSDGMLVGRELGAATVGLVGMSPAARSMAQLLGAFGSRVNGYDPSLHSSDSVWERWRVKPLGLRELLESSDAVCVQLSYFSRYHGLLGERFLPFCKPNQVIVSIAHSGLFDEAALAEAMGSGRIAAAWFDSLRGRWRAASTRYSRSRRPRRASSRRRLQTPSLILQSVPCCRELGDARLFLSHHRCRSTRDKTLVRQLDSGTRNFAVEPSDLLAESLAFCGQVDLHMQCQPCLPEHHHRRVQRGLREGGFIREHLHVRHLGQCLQQRCGCVHEASVTKRQQRHAHRR